MTPQLKDMKQFWHGLNKESQMKIIKSSYQIDEISKREEVIRSNNKWSNFKLRRALTIDRFLTLKKK